MRGKRSAIVLGLALFAILLSASAASALTLSWVLPTSYTDNTAIAAADRARIVCTPFVGPSSTGPWTAQTPTAQGATSATVPAPAPGQTMWYTVTATLDGQQAEKAIPASAAVPYKTPKAPTGLGVQ